MTSIIPFKDDLYAFAFNRNLSDALCPALAKDNFRQSVADVLLQSGRVAPEPLVIYLLDA